MLYVAISVCHTALTVFVRLLVVRVQFAQAVDSSFHHMLLGIGISVAATANLVSSSVKRWAPMSQVFCLRMTVRPGILDVTLVKNGAGFKLRLSMITQGLLDDGSQTARTRMRVRVRPKLASSDGDRSLPLGAVIVSNVNGDWNWPLEGSNLRPLVDETVSSYWCQRFSTHYSSQTRIAQSD